MPMLSINVLIPTIDARIEEVHKVLLPPQEGVSYLISQQFTDLKYRYLPDSLCRDDVKAGFIAGRGVSRNRNNLLRMADADIAVMSDDDVCYAPDAIGTIRRAYENDLELGMALFKLQRNLLQRAYGDREYILPRRSKYWAGSPEMTFRIAVIRAKNISFDERFGIAAGYLCASEERQFLKDALRRGVKTKYIPEFIASVSGSSTGAGRLGFSSPHNRTFGAVSYLDMGLWAIPAVFSKMVRYRRPLKKAKVSPFRFGWEYLAGIFYILTTKPRRTL